MSMQQNMRGQRGSDGGFVVMPPRASDVLSGALRNAYRPVERDPDPFGDLLRALDEIDDPRSH